ncbi:MAG: histidine phosphatase family protein [bacterium]
MQLIEKSLQIFLIRHGQSAWNGKKRITGQLDPPLSPKGVQQSQNLARVLEHKTLSAIYTSSLSRAVETARPTADQHGLAIHKRDALMELHFGVLQGKFRDHRDPETQALWNRRKENMIDFRVPGGETYRELEQRVKPCLNQIIAQHEGRAVLIVGHRNTNRVILAALMDWPREVAIELNLRSKYLYEISSGKQPQLKTICIDEKRLGREYAGFKM